MRAFGKKARVFLSTMAIAVSLFGTMDAADVGVKSPTIGIANFKNCVEKSKLGKREQAAFENLKTQMDAILEKKEKEINEIAAKLNDPDYLDSLSTEADAELRHKFRAATQELSSQQNQYYQALSQANVKIVQMITEVVEKAATQVAKQKNLTMVLNDEACYFFTPEADITNLIVVEMDRILDSQPKEPNSGAAK